ncbi:MAG: glycosyltransferase family 39 protein [Candidatus Omnitrophica bacterium]|nr:glycosyltransferase family 39 protein [Candidatus Omnitrophota bacterium]
MRNAKAWWPLGVALLAYLPFLSQAYHIDDTFFLAIAEHIRTDWTHPYGFSYNWLGTVQPTSLISANSPLFSYWLAGVIAVAGRAEWVLHLACFPFVAAVVVAMQWLGRRFHVSPAAAALLLIATPAIMVSSHTCMPDLASLAGYLLALAWFIHGYDRERWPWMVAAGVAAGFSALCRYPGLGVLVIWGLYALLQPPRTARRVGLGVLAGLVALGVFGAWCAISYAQYGEAHPATAARFIALWSDPMDAFGGRIFTTLAYLGGATIVPPAFAAVLPGHRSRARWLNLGCLVVAGAVAALLMLVWHYTLSQGLLAALFIWAGLAAVALLAGRPLMRDVWARPWTAQTRDQLFLAAWGLFVLVPLCLPIYFPAVRRMLPLVAPIVLLFLRRLQTRRSRAVPMILVATALLGLVVSAADMAQANVYRHFVEEKVPTLGLSPERTRFAGHWGFQYYMERAGFRPLDQFRETVQPGELVLLAYQPWPQVTVALDDIPLVPGTRMTSRDGATVILVPPIPWLPIRTVSWISHAHFYSNRHVGRSLALLPYSVSRAPLDVFVLNRAKPPNSLEGS